MTTATMTADSRENEDPRKAGGKRIWYLFLAVMLMCMISGVQYSWTLYARPMRDALGVSLAAVQVSFTLSQVIQSVSQPGGGYFVDRLGPKLPAIVGGILVGGGWFAMGFATNIPMLYVLYTISGAGVGVIYGIAINTANRWFPDRRGMASGFTAAGYGLGVLPFLPLITTVIKDPDWGVYGALKITGIIMGAFIVLIAFFIRFPGGAKPKKPEPTERDFRTGEMLKTKHFWLCWISFFSVNFGFLFLVANSAPFGRSMGIVAGTMAVCVMMQNLFNGGCRPFWGAVSDKIGRYKTLSIMFGVNAVAMFLFGHVAPMGVVFFIIMLAVAFFTAGGSYALFPAINQDLFGTAFSAQNYGCFWAAKACASIFGGGVGAAVATQLGWTVAFSISGAMSTLSFILMTFVIPRLGRPQRKVPVTASQTQS